MQRGSIPRRLTCLLGTAFRFDSASGWHNFAASAERGQRNVSLVNIEKLCTALGTTIADVFHGL